MNLGFTHLVKKELEEVEETIYSIIPKEPAELYGMLPAFIKRGGKRIRPALALLSSLAVGGEARNAIKPAALIEMFHNFTLIHDDIEDDSQMRRGEPTLNVTYGVPIALNAGDALYTLLWNESASMDKDPKRTVHMQKMLSSAFLKVVEGQGIELGWYKTKRVNISEEDYFSMVRGKTGALVALSCEIGAYSGGADKKTCEALRNFGDSIGIAFQIQDDILNVTGEFEKYKKEIGGDITEGKRTIMVAKAFEKANETEKNEMKRILTSHTKLQEEISYMINIFEKYGTIDYARKKAKKITDEAKACLNPIREGKAKEALLEVADFITSREV